MFKKIVSIVLATVLALGMLSACGQTNEEVDVEAADTEATSRVAMTLTLWLPTENCTAEAAEAVSAALNRLTQAKYDTALDIKFIPRNEYADAINGRLDEIRSIEEAEEEAAEAYRKWVKEQKAMGITVEETEEVALSNMLSYLIIHVQKQWFFLPLQVHN